MSVTITIRNNARYCRENNLVETLREPCCDNKNCPYCHGSGVYAEQCLPFEMNLSNDNFRTFTSALGLEAGWTGETSPHTVLQLLNAFDPALSLRVTEKRFNEGQVRSVTFGITPEQVERYVTCLKAIALAAEQREETIVWG